MVRAKELFGIGVKTEMIDTCGQFLLDMYRDFGIVSIM